MASRFAKTSGGPPLLVIVFLLVMLPGLGLRAQGCSQCRDNISQTNPERQASYRAAILILLGTVMAFSATAVIVIRRLR